MAFCIDVTVVAALRISNSPRPRGLCGGKGGGFGEGQRGRRSGEHCYLPHWVLWSTELVLMHFEASEGTVLHLCWA